MTIGVVLAGGRSSRFGRDKLAVPVGGEPLLWRPIRALHAAGCAVIVVVIGPDGPEPGLPWPTTTTGLPARGDRVDPTDPPILSIARDREPFGGPLAGLCAGLASVGVGEDSVVLVVGGDQPSLEPAVLIALAGRVEAGAAAAILADPEGRPRPLPVALRSANASETGERLLAAGRRRLRDLLDELAAEVIDRKAWRALDRSSATLADIDEPADLA